jgi:hypothetical protein
LRPATEAGHRSRKKFSWRDSPTGVRATYRESRRAESHNFASLRAGRLAQITCSIHDGNSGGPVLGTDGRVVAIATYGASSFILPDGAVEIRHAFDLICNPHSSDN